MLISGLFFFSDFILQVIIQLHGLVALVIKSAIGTAYIILLFSPSCNQFELNMGTAMLQSCYKPAQLFFFLRFFLWNFIFSYFITSQFLNQNTSNLLLVQTIFDYFSLLVVIGFDHLICSNIAHSIAQNIIYACL